MRIYRQKEFGLKKWFDKLRIKLHKITPSFLRRGRMKDISGNPELERDSENISGLSSVATGALIGSNLGGGLLFNYNLGRVFPKLRHKSRNFLRGSSRHIDEHYQRKFDRRAVANGDLDENEYFEKWNIK